MSSSSGTEESSDLAIVPFAVAAGLPAITLVWGLHLWLKLRRKMDDGSKQVFHGLLMMLFAYPLGILIPHTVAPQPMKVAHSVSLLQAIFLVGLGSVWHTHIGFKSGERDSVVAKWINLYGFWFNSFGMIFGAFTGAKSLFYISAPFIQVEASPEHEAILQFVLKSQGTCNIIACVMMIRKMASKYANTKPHLE